jgi:hypothetical protein
MYELVKLLKHLETIAILFLALASTWTVSNAAAEGNNDANELAALKGRAAATFSDYTTPQLFDVLQSKSANWYEREALVNRHAVALAGAKSAKIPTASAPNE